MELEGGTGENHDLQTRVELFFQSPVRFYFRLLL